MKNTISVEISEEMSHKNVYTYPLTLTHTHTISYIEKKKLKLLEKLLLRYSCRYRMLHAMCLVTQLCLILCDPMDCIPPGSSVHKIFQARILE